MQDVCNCAQHSDSYIVYCSDSDNISQFNLVIKPYSATYFKDLHFFKNLMSFIPSQLWCKFRGNKI